MFSALRQGSPLYIFDKAKDITLKEGTVEGVSIPRPRYPYSVPYNGESIVDIKVKVGNDTIEFKGAPSNVSIGDCDGVVISESRDAIANEVSSVMHQSQQIIENIDYHKDRIKKCDDILKKLNPSYAKEKSMDDTIQTLKSEMGELKDGFGSIKEELSKLLTTLNP